MKIHFRKGGNFVNRTLQMTFLNAEDRNTSISISDPLEELDLAEVEAAMQSIVDTNIFSTAGGDITAKVRAQVISRDVETLLEF